MIYSGFSLSSFAVHLLLLLTLLLPLGTQGADRKIISPFEATVAFKPLNQIDNIVIETLDKKGLSPAPLCSDSVFLRRVFLDVIGTLPTTQEFSAFQKNRRLNKRAVVIDALLDRKEFADYWAMKWSDLLRVKAEFPINLWPNAVQAYHRWIRESIVTNKPYDQFVRELLTSSGSNFRVGPVNFYRAIQGQEPSTIATAVGLTFMGSHVENWPEAKRKDLEIFFSRVKYKPTAEWKEEIICLNPAPVDTIKATFPDGKMVRIDPNQDPRVVFADWLITDENPWFTRSIVNRVWYWLMNRGIIHEPDDIRDDNPATHPELLVYLQKELVKSNYDLRHIYRLILNSRIYQQSSIPNIEDPDAEKFFAQYPVRRLDAEVLIDALNYLFGGSESYSSAIPEPYTFIPDQHRTIELADGSISSSFLEMYGRPARDTGLESERNNEATGAQRMHLLNSTHVQSKIERSTKLQNLMKQTKNKRPALINAIYISILTRYPTQAEIATADKYFQKYGKNVRNGVLDLTWALINGKEFLYRH